MANPSTAHEPSMEEILASIRQIISEDGEAAAGSRSESRYSARVEPEGRGDADIQVATAARPAPPPALAPAPASSPAPAPSAFSRSDGEADAEPQKPASYESSSKPEPYTPPVSSAPKPPQDSARRDLSATLGQPRPEADAQRAKSSGEDRTLLSERSDAAVSGAFSVLAHTILAQNARTLEDLVAEMLRPMLKNWLDENLPALVEKLVKEEIERVSRGRR